MMIEPIHVVALSPLLITAFTSVVVMLSVAWRRHHFFNATMTVIGLNAALVATAYAWQQLAQQLQKESNFSGIVIQSLDHYLDSLAHENQL